MSVYDWQAVGIELRGRASGNVKTTCPWCSPTRHKTRERCLSVKVEDGVYNCWNCARAGRAPLIGGFIPMPPKRTFRKPEYQPGPDPQDRVVAWFQSRGISEAIVRRNRIEARKVQYNDKDAPEWAIAFPYLRGGEVVNIQYRTVDKRFKSETGCEMIFYGLDDLQEGEPIIFVEGQMDKLALEESGYLNCLSVPNGADSKLDDPLTTIEATLRAVPGFIIAGDNDEKGIKLQEELIRRLGPERCSRVEWPDGCKDANDALMKYGRESVIEAIECAQPMPISGIVRYSDLMPDLEQLYYEGVKPGEDPGWPALAKYYRPRAGEWTMVTGAPSMGKSAVLDALLVNLAKLSDWRFGVYSPEHLPLKHHAASLLEIWTGWPFNPGPSDRMTMADVRTGVAQLDDYFTFIHDDDDTPSVDRVLGLARVCVQRYGIKGFVIDPWNELEHSRPAQMSETEHVSQSLSKIRRFARTYDVHVWVMVHPTKLQKKEDGSYPVASPYDAHGSAHWFNKADMILSVWRDKTNQHAPVEIHVQKVRFRENGQLGKAELWYDQRTGRLNDLPAYVDTYRESED